MSESPATPNNLKRVLTNPPFDATSAPVNGVLDTAAFLSLLYGDVRDGELEITYLAPDEARVDRIAEYDPDGKRRRVGTVVHWRSLPLGVVDPRMKRLHEMNRRGYGVHFGVTVRRERKQGEWRERKDTGERYWCFYPRGRQADAQYITALWGEVDAKDFGGDLDAARRAIEAHNPSILIFSGAGWHGYWLLDTPLEITDDNRADVKRTLRGIAKAIGGDAAVADLARVMRLPGFKNTKPGRNGVVCELIYAHDRRSTFAELFATYAPLITVAPKRTVASYTAGNAEEEDVVDALNHIPADSIPYIEWITTLAALHSAFDESTATSIAERWSGAYSKTNEIADKMASFDGGYSGPQATLGSLFHLAKRYGYQRKTELRIVECRIDLRDHAPSDYEKQGEAKQSPYFHAEGAPRTWLLAICQAFAGHRNMPHFARLWFEGQRRGLIDPCDVTYGALLEARTMLGIPLKDSAVRACMKLMEGLFWNLNWCEKTSSETEKTSGGRPTEHFQAATLAEIASMLPAWAAKRIEEARHQERNTTPRLTNQMIAALDGDARAAALEILPALPPASEQARTSSWLANKNLRELVQSLRDLTPTNIPLDCPDVRAALFAEEITPDEKRSYTDIKRGYGLSKGQVATLVKRAGLKPIEQTVACPIHSVQTFERDVYEARKREKGFPVALVEVKATGERVKHHYLTGDALGNQQLVEAAIERGNRVEVVMRTANKYQPAEVTELTAVEAPKAPSRRVNYHEPSEIRPYYGTGYNPTVVRHWLKTWLVRMGWRKQGTKYTNPDTGEVYDLRERGFLEFAESLGAEVQVIAS